MTQAISDPKQASAALAELFGTHKRVVFFGGAGVSTAGEAAELRGGHVGLLAAGAAAHHGCQVIIGLRRGLRGRGGLGDRGSLLGGRCLLLLLVRGLGRRLRIAERQRGLHHATRELCLGLRLA